ncbi:MAG TPA: DUF3303 family protein [Terracidiphilus sp.]|nr:DUF3303 family protein [Terracidiphilus sp.]
MRMLVNVKLPVEPFNTAVRNGTAAALMKKVLDEVKPEAAYFTTVNGHRGGTLIVHIENASDIPRLAEPWFLNFNAQIEIHPAMTSEDLARADLDSIGKQWS